MEINSALPILEIQQNAVQQELKPVKGFNFNSNVQRFEQILFSEQTYLSKEAESIKNTDAKSAISRLGKAFFEKVESFKKSTDKRMGKVMGVLNQDCELSMKEVVELQWQVTMYNVETQLVSSCAGKVTEGVQTLFRNQ